MWARFYARSGLRVLFRISTIAGVATVTVASTGTAQTRGMVQVTALVTAADVEWDAWAAARRLVLGGIEGAAAPGLPSSEPPLYQLERGVGTLIGWYRRTAAVTVQYLRN
jgi:hypothetical protein